MSMLEIAMIWEEIEIMIEDILLINMKVIILEKEVHVEEEEQWLQMILETLITILQIQYHQEKRDSVAHTVGLLHVLTQHILLILTTSDIILHTIITKAIMTLD